MEYIKTGKNMSDSPKNWDYSDKKYNPVLEVAGNDGKRYAIFAGGIDGKKIANTVPGAYFEQQLNADGINDFSESKGGQPFRERIGQNGPYAVVELPEGKPWNDVRTSQAYHAHQRPSSTPGPEASQKPGELDNLLNGKAQEHNRLRQQTTELLGGGMPGEKVSPRFTLKSKNPETGEVVYVSNSKKNGYADVKMTVDPENGMIRVKTTGEVSVAMEDGHLELEQRDIEFAIDANGNVAGDPGKISQDTKSLISDLQSDVSKNLGLKPGDGMSFADSVHTTYASHTESRRIAENIVANIGAEQGLHASHAANLATAATGTPVEDSLGETGRRAFGDLLRGDRPPEASPLDALLERDFKPAQAPPPLAHNINDLPEAPPPVHGNTQDPFETLLQRSAAPAPAASETAHLKPADPALEETFLGRAAPAAEAAEDAAKAGAHLGGKFTKVFAKVAHVAPAVGLFTGGAEAAILEHKATQALDEGRISPEQHAAITAACITYTAAGTAEITVGMAAEEAIDASLKAANVPEDLRLGTLRGALADLGEAFASRHQDMPPEVNTLLRQMPDDKEYLTDPSLRNLASLRGDMTGLLGKLCDDPNNQELLTRLDMKVGQFKRDAEVYLRNGGSLEEASTEIARANKEMAEEQREIAAETAKKYGNFSEADATYSGDSSLAKEAAQAGINAAVPQETPSQPLAPSSPSMQQQAPVI